MSPLKPPRLEGAGAADICPINDPPPISRPLKRSTVETFSVEGASENRSNIGAADDATGAGEKTAAGMAAGAGFELPLPKADEKSAKSSPSSRAAFVG